MTDDQPTESIEFSDQDIADLQAIGVTDGEGPNFHPILEVWKAVLAPASTERHAKITPQYATRIVHTYRGVEYKDMGEFRDRFYDKIEALEQILLEVIASDEDCLTYTTPEEDREHNSKHYRTLLLEWQKQFLAWELAWSHTDEYAGVELGAMGEVHGFFFGDTGLTAHLQNIQFQYTEQDQAAVQEELLAMKDGGEDE